MAEPIAQPPQPRRIRGRYVTIALGLAAVVLVAWSVKVGRHYYIPKRFYEVEQNQLYRSGYVQPVPLKRVIEDKNIRTILCLLNDEPDNPDQQKEEAVARAKGVKLVRIGMPGDGRGRFEDLDRAADEMANTADRPILVHCAGGENRTGAVYAAYRMKYCGWGFEEAIAEGDKYGLSLRGKAPLVEHLKAYGEHLAATSRPATAPAETGSASP